MMKEFKYKINKTRFIIYNSTENYINSKVDILFNYNLPSLSEGDDLFVQLHKEGGSIIYQDCIKALTIESSNKAETLNEMPPGKVFLTNKGRLKCWKILHLVFPDKRENNEETCRSVVFQTLFQSLLMIQETFKNSENISSIALRPFNKLFIRDINTKDHEKFVKTILNNCNGLSEVHIYCEGDVEFKIVKKTLLNQTKSWFDLILIKLGF